MIDFCQLEGINDLQIFKLMARLSRPSIDNVHVIAAICSGEGTNCGRVIVTGYKCFYRGSSNAGLYRKGSK